MLVIGIAIDISDVERYALRMQRLMDEGRYAEALHVGDRSDKTDERLLELRIEALGHEKQLGERLFAYPVKGGSHSLTIGGKSLYSLGGDYTLCASLIDKDLDRFVELLPQYYEVDERLPRYYREALILYTHLRTNPKIVYHDAVMDTDYDDLQQLERKYPDRRARQVAVYRQYEGTYWYYYENTDKRQL